jgi:hypothetical protein
MSCGESDATGNAPENNPEPVQVGPKEDCSKLEGAIYRYNSFEEDTAEMAFTIVFNCKNDSLKALMFGPDPQEEHGLYFFKENLDSVKIQNGELYFSLVKRTLYAKQFTLDNYKTFPNINAGGSNVRTFYKGKLAGDSIVILCNNEEAGYNDCYSDTMVFRKK